MKQETTFIQFREALQKRFKMLSNAGNLYQAHVEKDLLWDTYLGSFPEGTNLIFRERREYDCQCCKRFIRNIGRVVGSVNGEMVTMFGNLGLEGKFAVVADEMDKLVREASIGTIYLNDEQTVGQSETYEQLEDGTVHTWEHFYQVLPQKAYSLIGDLGSRKGKAQTNFKVLKRSVLELTEYAVEVVLELIDQGSLHRGDEFVAIVKGLQDIQQGYGSATNKELFLWDATISMQNNNHDCNIRGTAIGTLLTDLSNDVELEVAVKKYEDKVSGTNYKRTTALVTKGMKERAVKRAKVLGIEPSIPRRMANKSDISVNDVVFADNSIKPFMEDSVFDVVKTVSNNPMNFGKIEEVTVSQFMKNILPKAESLEVFLENKHEANMMTLVAPINSEAPCIMKWGNNFSWSYNGEFAESVIKERVKSAGGVVDAPLRISLSWNKRDDLDLHLYEPCGNKVYYSNKRGRTGCMLDIDMRGEKLNQVENIYWNGLNLLAAGIYRVDVQNFQRNSNRSGEQHEEGFTLEMEYKGEVVTIPYTHVVKDDQVVNVLTFQVHKDGSVTINPIIDSSKHIKTKEVWGINTGEFHKVDMVMKSPNYWENSNKTGNEHLFFILDGCVNPDKVRGMYNEFLIQELNEDRKVFETLASELKAEYSEDQLSGVGFSTTLRNDMTVRVKGSFNRVIKIKF